MESSMELDAMGEETFISNEEILSQIEISLQEVKKVPEKGEKLQSLEELINEMQDCSVLK